DKLVNFFSSIHPLDRVPRAGWVLRGVPDPESVAAHSHFTALLVMLFVDRYPDHWDREKALTMALIHDLPEAFLMDIPMPVSDSLLGDSKKRAELTLTESLFHGFSFRYADLFQELYEKKSGEARLVAGLDKAQMMLKLLGYMKANWGNLDEFWENGANFRDYGIPEVGALFDEICRKAGKKRPITFQT
ncbi:MAG TPA: HD family hydrolase, partial [Spirochaetia bacterium]|nr:HD family hydrolase [Spirochaetia bacterium]